MNTERRRHLRAALALTLGIPLATRAVRASEQTEAAQLVDQARNTVDDLARDADFASLRQAMAKAQGVLVFPRILKAGLVVGGFGGNGVLLVRDASTGEWWGPAFYTMAAASLGLQAGASTAEVVMVINSQRALESLYSNKVQLGGDASFAVGRKGGGTGASMDADFVVYSKARGLFAGVSVDGSVLDVRETLNAAYYGLPVSPLDILVRRVKTEAQASALRLAVAAASK